MHAEDIHCFKKAKRLLHRSAHHCFVFTYFVLQNFELPSRHIYLFFDLASSQNCFKNILVISLATIPSTIFQRFVIYFYYMLIFLHQILKFDVCLQNILKLLSNLLSLLCEVYFVALQN